MISYADRVLAEHVQRLTSDMVVIADQIELMKIQVDEQTAIHARLYAQRDEVVQELRGRGVTVTLAGEIMQAATT